MNKPALPMQPIEVVNGQAHFVPNSIVRWLYERSNLGREDVQASVPCTPAEWGQFMQLVGHSVHGYIDRRYGTPGEREVIQQASYACLCRSVRLQATCVECGGEFTQDAPAQFNVCLPCFHAHGSSRMHSGAER